MRITALLALLGAATHVLANAQPKQLHEPVAVAVAARLVDSDGGSSLCQVDATSALKGQATPAPAVISGTEPENEASWRGVNTTVTVEAGAWSGNTTSES
jgi:hypothetical protein